MKKKYFLLIICTALFTITDCGRAYSRPEWGQYARCFAAAGRKYNINPRILKAIALTESNFNPFAVNVGGKSYFFSSISDAYSFLRKNLRKKPDIGLMQVNYYWFRVLHIPILYGFNPCHSIFLGAYVLRKKINRYGKGWFGIAAYHSATPIKNIKYAWKVYGSLQKIDSNRWE